MAQLSYLLIYGIIRHFVLNEENYVLGTCNIDQFNEASKVREDCIRDISGALEVVNTTEFPSSGPIAFARKLCSLKPKIDECVDKANNKITPCLNSTQTHGLELWKKVDTEITEYLCGNNGKTSFTYLKREASCWKEGVKNASEKCFLNTVTISTPFYDIPKLQQHCNDFDAFDICLSKNLPESCPPDTMDLISPIIKKIKNGICSDIPTGPDAYKEFFKNALSLDYNIFDKL